MKNHTSISHYTGRERQALLRLKNKIVALYKPLIIYLIGCNSSNKLARNCLGNARNGNQWCFSCDLLLVLPEGVSLPENAVEELKSIAKDYEHIRLIAHPFDFVEKQLQEDSLFFCWMQRKAIVLYERDNSIEKLPEPVQNMKQYEKQVHQFFADNPNYENYTEVKLSPLPAKSSTEIVEDSEISETTIESFKSYLEYHDPKTVNRNIRTVLVDYIRTTQAGYPFNFKEILWDFMDLMEVFDVAEDEQELVKSRL